MHFRSICLSAYVSVCATKLFSAPRRPILPSEVPNESSSTRDVSDYIHKAVYSTGAFLDAKIGAVHYLSITDR